MIAVFVLFAAPVSATAAQSDAAALFEKQCAACHAVDGSGLASMGVPAVAGQSAAYLQRSLAAYASNWRGAAGKDRYAQQMVAIAQRLSESEQRDLSTFMASLNAPDKLVGSNQVDANLANGKRYYQANCGSCHGPQAEGNDALNSPSLRHLDLAYLSRQYQNYVDGLRGYHNKDKFGRQMQMIASQTEDKKTVSDILSYIVSLP